MARNFSLIPAGTTGRLLDAGAVAPRGLAAAVPPFVESPAVDAVVGAIEGDGCLDRTGSINVLIWFFVSGPHKYDIAQRDSNTTGASSCTLFIRNTRLPSAASVASMSWRLNDEPACADAPSNPSITRALSRAVCNRPRNQVPAFDKPL